MKNNPLVSVIVITYNSEKYVLETLESAKAQTYKNIELIVSDDCSTDKTVEICQDWLDLNKTRFAHVYLLTVEINTGVTANCNRAVKSARGEWIKLIGGDDILMDTCIEENIQYINQHHEAFCVESGIYLINEKSEIIGNKLNGPDKHFHDIRTSAYFQHKLLLWTYPVNILCIFYKKKILEEIDYYDEEIPHQEDVSFLFRLTIKGFKIYYFPEITVKRRLRQGTLSGYSDTRLIKQNYIDNSLKTYNKYKYPHMTFVSILFEKYNEFIRLSFYRYTNNKKTVLNLNMLKIFLAPYIVYYRYKMHQLRRDIERSYLNHT